MKLIEALKKRNELKKKIDDINAKISKYCADHESETPTYKTPEDQRKQIDSWIQSVRDITFEIEKLSLQISRTNNSTIIQIDLNGNLISKPISSWIIRRQDLINLETRSYEVLTNRGLTQKLLSIPGQAEKAFDNVRKYFDQATRDRKIEELTSEKSKIDSTLEIINATTDLVE